MNSVIISSLLLNNAVHTSHCSGCAGFNLGYWLGFTMLAGIILSIIACRVIGKIPFRKIWKMEILYFFFILMVIFFIVGKAVVLLVEYNDKKAIPTEHVVEISTTDAILDGEKEK